MRLSTGWKTFLILSLIAGLFLRTIYVRDMEYKEDERYNYTQSQLIGASEPWPAYGIASGIYVVNPGMSVWVFAALAKVTGARTPTQLERALQLFALLGICLVLIPAFRYVEPYDREPWLWAFALALVNPITLLYQRKLWPEPFLPVFSVLTLMGWWKRKRKPGALTWGFVGALIGQIHMSGFFFAAGLVLWTFLFDRRSARWGYWFIGSVLGSLSLLPWLHYLLSHPLSTALASGWGEAMQLKYWVFWISGAFGMHLGNSLGLLIGDTQWQELSDFVRYPLIRGHATYVVGLAHLGIICVMAWVTINLVRDFENHLRLNWRRWRDRFIGRESPAAFAQNAVFWGSGILMELTNVNIRRYYMCVVFPLALLWLARAALRNNTLRASPPGRRWLGLLWACQLVISIGFVHYIHVNHGSPKGDYGDAYEVVISRQVTAAKP